MKNADSANNPRVSRRALLTGAAATLPAVPAFALPSLVADDEDERLNDLLACAKASGVSLDLLHAATCTLDRDARRSVLASIAGLAVRYDIALTPREQSDHDALSRASDGVAAIMERIVAKHSEADSWSADVSRYDANGRSFYSSYALTVDESGPMENGWQSIRSEIVERQVCRDGTFTRDPGFPMERKA